MVPLRASVKTFENLRNSKKRSEKVKKTAMLKLLTLCPVFQLVEFSNLLNKKGIVGLNFTIAIFFFFLLFHFRPYFVCAYCSTYLCIFLISFKLDSVKTLSPSQWWRSKTREKKWQNKCLGTIVLKKSKNGCHFLALNSKYLIATSHWSAVLLFSIIHNYHYPSLQWPLEFLL